MAVTGVLALAFAHFHQPLDPLVLRCSAARFGVMLLRGLGGAFNSTLTTRHNERASRPLL